MCTCLITILFNLLLVNMVLISTLLLFHVLTTYVCYPLKSILTFCRGNWLDDPGCSNLVLRDNLQGWEGVGGVREVHEGGDTCIPMAGSCWCTRWQKPTQYCEAVIVQLKINFKTYPHQHLCSFWWQSFWELWGVSHCRFDLHFSNSDVQHLFMCLYIFSGRTSVHVFWPFFNWVVCFYATVLCRRFIYFAW